MTVTQTLDVVCGLVSSMEVVMEGARCLLQAVWLDSWYKIRICRWQGIDRRCPPNPWYV